MARPSDDPTSEDSSFADGQRDDPQEETRLLEARRRMVAAQIQARGIDDPRVLDAMLRVPRERFVPPTHRAEAHADWALPLALGQTISQPFTVAFMADALQLTGDDRVLEIGAGSGYGAAVLSRLAREVHTIERHAPLAEQARRRLRELGYANVHVHVGDGTLGYPAHAPYDAICVTAAAERLPPALAEQLADGGRIVAPLGPLRGGQRLVRLTRHGDEWTREDLGAFSFVPLIGAQGWSEASSDNPTR